MPLLDDIVADARTVVSALRPTRRALELAAEAAPVPRPFAAGLRGETVAVIAELKRRSPSTGALDEQLDPGGLGRDYQRGGAAAISVLTNARYFGGSIDDLAAVARAVNLPVLRKDFIVDEVQLLEARAAGASAALLIVRIVAPPRLRMLVAFGRSIGLALLVEAHRAEEVDVAIDSGAELIGVNARDLDTLAIDTARAWQMLAAIPVDRIAVAESGVRDRAGVESAGERGADAVLVGAALVAAGDPELALRAMLGVPRRGR